MCLLCLNHLSSIAETCYTVGPTGIINLRRIEQCHHKKKQDTPYPFSLGLTWTQKLSVCDLVTLHWTHLNIRRYHIMIILVGGTTKITTQTPKKTWQTMANFERWDVFLSIQSLQRKLFSFYFKAPTIMGSVAQLLADSLEAHGIDQVFCVPGAVSYTHLRAHET